LQQQLAGHAQVKQQLPRPASIQLDDQEFPRARDRPNFATNQVLEGWAAVDGAPVQVYGGEAPSGELGAEAAGDGFNFW
jgi:hypothetical protein